MGKHARWMQARSRMEEQQSLLHAKVKAIWSLVDDQAAKNCTVQASRFERRLQLYADIEDAEDLAEFRLVPKKTKAVTALWKGLKSGAVTKILEETEAKV